MLTFLLASKVTVRCEYSNETPIKRLGCLTKPQLADKQQIQYRNTTIYVENINRLNSITIQGTWALYTSLELKNVI